ncbi:MAG: PspC domain-containing protein [Runella sp.]
MKKTISINIAGLIFYIEEDGYDKLRNYLNSIQKYFSAYEDSKEIISDIEGRIAEKFLQKQKNAEKQAISLDDVEELIKSMGTVADFEAVEEEEDLATNAGERKTKKEEAFENISQPTSPTQRKPLVRDMKRKLLGGVCAGIAHYFSTDPLLIRLIFLFFFIGLPAIGGSIGNNAEDFFGSLAGIVFLVYVACWVAFPGSNDLEEDKTIKKFYRDPDRKVVGGVAAGVGAYFGVDLGVVRFLWVLSILFFGTGLMLYLILWVITPKATTLTEKMEMTGQPITLENIETNVKKALQPDQHEENTLTKLLLFPFRAIAMIFGGLAPLMKFLVVILRFFAGLMLFLIGACVLIGLLVALFSILGLNSANVDWIDADFWPAQFLLGEIPSGAYLFFFFAIAVPFAALAWIGISLLTNENKFTPVVWQTMLGLFLLGVVGSVVTGTKYSANFRKTGRVEETKTYALPKQTLLLEVNDDYDSDYRDRNIGFRMEGQDSPEIKVDIEYIAKGTSRKDAENNASTISYNIAQKDSILAFDQHFALKERAKFRGQNVNLKLYLPYDKPFAMSRDFYRHFWVRGQLNDREYDLEKEEENESMFRAVRWAFKKDSGLVCLNRPLLKEDAEGDSEDNSDNLSGLSDDIESNLNRSFDSAFERRGEMTKQFEVKDFNRINISGAFVVKITKGNTFKLTADGREEDIEDLEVKVENGTLRVGNRQKIKVFGKTERIGLTLTLPTVTDINLAGATIAKIEGFDNLASLDLDIAGASKTIVNIAAQKLDLSVSGASKVELYGSANTLHADLAGACSLDAEQMRIQNAEVSASGVSKANMGKIANLRSSTSGVSKVTSEGRE